jgi:NAD kinase
MVTFAPAVDADQLRLRHEFLAMPGLTLTASQTARLLDVRLIHAEELLASLESEGLLVHTPSGAYRRAEPPLA